MLRKVVDSIPIWQFEILAPFDSLCHGITTRQGGASEAPYDELNVGLHVGDCADRVVQNRRRACRALDVDFERCTFAQQVHGDTVRIAAEDSAGAGRRSFDDGTPETDGLVVTCPGVTVAVVVADCVPLLLYDPERHTGAVVHAGWRGTGARIAEKAVAFLARECSSRPEALLAGIGPAIGGCCYEVSSDIVETLSHGRGSEAAVVEERDGRWHVDLAGANWQQLTQAGLRPGNIELSRICTACRSDEVYSERKLGRPTGRFGLFLSLRPCD